MKKKFVFLLISISIFSFSQEKRLALLIGNSAYEHGGVLKNPANDAFAMKQALSYANFDVMEYYNLDEGELKQAIDEFGLRLKNYQVGLFFYAGHGIQANGENYLIPVDANLKSEQQVEYDCVEANRVLAQMDASGTSVNIVILDACRNNPFERSWSRTAKGRGLAFMNAPTGSLIAYATAPGSTASDGSGRNGLYTEAILESIQIPGITILEMFQIVRNGVVQKSNNQQIPWESTSLVGNFYFIDSGVKKGGDNFKIVDYSDNIIEPRNGIIIDTRDHEEYNWLKIGDQIWMKENMNYNLIGSSCYENYSPNCQVYGKLYSWNLAVHACPDGWHLPTDEEWKQLEMQLGLTKEEADGINIRDSFVGGKLKEKGLGHWLLPNEEATNESGFTARPAGYRNPDGKYEGESEIAAFWTMTEKDELSSWCRILDRHSGGISRERSNKLYELSVRCVKD